MDSTQLGSRGFGYFDSLPNSALPYPLWDNEKNFSYFSSWDWAASKGIPDPHLASKGIPDPHLASTNLSHDQYYQTAARSKPDWSFSPSSQDARQIPVMVRALHESEAMALRTWVGGSIKW